MAVLALVIDIRAAESCACGAPTSLLMLPLGARPILGEIAERVGALPEGDASELWVVPAFEADEPYGRRLEALGVRVKVVPSERLDAALAGRSGREQVVVFDAGRWPVGTFNLEGFLRRHVRERVVTHLVAVGAAEPRAREWVERDEQGRVTRIQRVYGGVALPEAASCGAFMTIAPAAALRGVRFRSVPELRGALAEKGEASRDVALPIDVIDLEQAEGVLAVNERWFAAKSSRGGNGVVAGSGCRIDPSARLIGPVVLHEDVRVAAGATIVGPTVIGAGCTLEERSIVAQAVLAPGTLVRSGVTLRHCIASGSCLACPEGTAPRAPARMNGPGVPGRRPKLAGASSAARPTDRRRQAHLACKRVMDVVLAAAGLILLSPLLIAVAIVVKATSPGPVFFIHRREQREGKEFGCVKFRTMEADAHERQQELMERNEVDGPQFKLREDPRVTRVGGWLRRTNIDELPQLFNVLVGHMSLVGPRPSPFKENQICVPWRRARLSVRPGITGLWQICRSPDRTAGDFHEWIFYDIAYVRHFTIWLDFKIILATIVTRGGRRSMPMSRLVPEASGRGGHRSRMAISR